MPPTPPRAPDFAVGLRLGGSWGAHSVGPFKRWSRSSSASLPGSAGRAGGRFPARPLRLRPRGGLRPGGPTGLRIWRSVERAGGRFLARPLRLRPRGGVRSGGPTGLRIWRSVERAGGRFLARPLRLRPRGGVRSGGPTGLRALRSVERAGGRFLARPLRLRPRGGLRPGGPTGLRTLRSVCGPAGPRGWDLAVGGTRRWTLPGSPPAAAPARWCAARRAHRASDLAVGLRPGGPTGLRTSPSVCGPASRGVRAPAVAPARRTGGAWPEARRRAFLHRRPPRRGRPAASPGRSAPSRPYFPGSTCDHAVRPTSSGGCGG
ncbi:hypothetical protein SUDANB130_05832 [Streptomyces sp. enrichment culture]